MLVDKRAKEIFGSAPTVFLPKQFVVAALAQQLGDECVGVIGSQVGIALLQGVDFVVVIKEAAHPQMFLVFRDGIEVEHRLVEPAELVSYHRLARLLTQWAKLVVCPGAHPLGHLEGRFVLAHRILIDESLEQLVKGVERRPDAFSLNVAVNQSLAEGRQVARAILPLHLCQSLHQRVGFLLHLQIGHCREQMAGGVSAQVAVGRLPSPEP